MRHETMTIDYTLTLSPLGWLLLAATPYGICHLIIYDTQMEAIEQLKKICSHPVRHHLTRPLEHAKNIITDWLTCILTEQNNQDTTQLPSFDTISLDLASTIFLSQVRTALQAIPIGSTLSYFELAHQIGRPKAVRAVAQACARNPVAILIPCHRIIGKNQQLTGYRWGIKRKQQLLLAEAAFHVPCVSQKITL